MTLDELDAEDLALLERLNTQAEAIMMRLVRRHLARLRRIKEAAEQIPATAVELAIKVFNE